MKRHGYGRAWPSADIEVKASELTTSRFDRYALAGAGPRCLTHNDFRPDNMMFRDASRRPGRWTVLDWQSIGRWGPALSTSPTFLAGALPFDVRRAHQDELLRRYLQGLTAGGVAGYGPDDLARDYATGAFLLFLTAFFAAMIVKQTARGDDMFMQMVDSATGHILDHGALETLAERRPSAGPRGISEARRSRSARAP